MNQRTTVLFDLDGTLLPMDQDVFGKAYFGGMAKKMAPYGYDPQRLVKAIWTGTEAMVKNDGSITNEDFIIIDKEDFVSMIYDCVNDHTMLHNIYEAFVNHDAEASDAVMKKYETLL